MQQAYFVFSIFRIFKSIVYEKFGKAKQVGNIMLSREKF